MHRLTDERVAKLAEYDCASNDEVMSLAQEVKELRAVAKDFLRRNKYGPLFYRDLYNVLRRLLVIEENIKYWKGFIDEMLKPLEKK